MTMIVVTHELRFARRVAQSIAMMDNGRIVEEADPETFFAGAQHERTRRFIEALE
jgi:polar amino acid transport system ATP-binding protein